MSSYRYLCRCLVWFPDVCLGASTSLGVCGGPAVLLSGGRQVGAEPYARVAAEDGGFLPLGEGGRVVLALEAVYFSSEQNKWR